jgi:hypothetical protein
LPPAWRLAPACKQVCLLLLELLLALLATPHPAEVRFPGRKPRGEIARMLARKV